MKLCFVSVNGPREPYLLDEPRIWHLAISKQLKLKLAACFIPKTDLNLGPLQLLTHGHNYIISVHEIPTHRYHRYIGN
jgi:hypothetical protein